ncbi:MAG: sodium:solute symporter family protein, partial [Planctomycetota bacterium]|nr:sodium:solute symporter family protein [Planctomycetota bacterium]
CRPGVFGFVLAALTAALMSTADSLINAVSAIFVNDIWRPYIRPASDDKHYLKVARIASLVAAGLGLALVPLFMKDTLYGAHSMFTAAVTPPVLMAILLGITWKRYTPMAAFVTIVGGAVLIGLSFVWPDALVGPFDFGMGPDSYKFMRGLFGLLSAGALGVSVTWFTKSRAEAELKGLVAGTQMDAMRQFKGGEPNRRSGVKVQLQTAIDRNLSGTNVIVVSQSALETMAAEPGDLLYVSHSRWWYGGLRSVHVKAGSPTESGDRALVRISPEDAATAHFIEGQKVVIEKIM